jgi:hypothetical protein
MASGRRITAQLFFRHYPLKAPAQDGEKAEIALAQLLANTYRLGVERGYDAAVSDFFHADENWYATMPTLHRIVGGIRRWYR